MFFKRIIIGFFVIFASLMLFIYFIRLANGKTGFLGLSDLLDYFNSGNIDFYKPLHVFNSDIGGIIRDFQSFMNNIQINNFWDALVTAVEFLGKILKLIYIPILFIFDLIKMLFGYISIFTDFIGFIISFEGYPGITY